MKPRVTASIVLYNSAEVIVKCLTCLEQYDSSFLEIIVVDNASPDNSSEIVAKQFPEVKIIKSEKNVGFAGGHNLAWGAVSGDYWLILNPDAFLSPDALFEMVRVMDEQPKAGLVSPQLVGLDGTVSFLAMSFPSVSLAILDLTRVMRLLPKSFRANLLKIPSSMPGDVAEVDWVPGTALMVRKEVAQLVGLLNEEIFMYAEDVEFCWRVKKSGWKVLMLKTVEAKHVGSKSSEGVTRESTVENSIQNYVKVDTMIVGWTRARMLHLMRTVSYGLESIKFWASQNHRSKNKIIFEKSLRFVFNGLFRK